MCLLPPLFSSALTVLVVAAAILSAGCGDESSTTEATPQSGIDLTGIDHAVRPQDDLFAFVNGRWLRETEIPADKTSWGTFDTLRERTFEQLRDIVESLPEQPRNHNEQLVATLYQEMLTANQAPVTELDALAPQLEIIGDLSDHGQLPAMFAALSRSGVTTPLVSWVGQDRRQSDQHVVYLSQSGLGLPDRDYYSDDSTRGQALLDSYGGYLERLLELAGDDRERSSRVAAVIELERRLASHHWSRVENRDAENTYNPLDQTALIRRLSPEWQSYFETLEFSGQPRYVVRQPDYIEQLQQLVGETSLEVWRDYLSLHLLRAYAPWLGSEFDAAYFDLYGRDLGGAEEPEPLWKRAISNLNNRLDDALGQLYVEQHFPPKARERMLTMTDHLKEAFRDSIANLAWMSPTTRMRALEKLDTLNTKVGYPDQWRDYSELKLEPGDLIGNFQRIRQWHHRRDVALLDEEVDPDEWFMPVQTVNAYYSPTMNEIVFPAAILQPPFFNMDADDAVNYGAIGGVIGHEIGHAFDDQGSRYDADGNLNNWWTAEDRERFEALGEQLVEQFSQYQPLPDEYINGQLTLGENIGDLGGLSMAARAYQLALDGSVAPVIDGFTGEQRLFMGWAQAWRVKRRDELVRRLLRTGPHSQPEFRVNGVVTNIDGFHEAFDTGPEDQLYKPETDRIRIW